MKRLAILFLLAAPVWGQLEVLTLQGREWGLVTGPIPMGETPTGEPLDTVIRLRNAGQNPATLSSLSITGAGFSLFQAPTPPLGLAGGMILEFYVRFRVDSAAADARANLRINNATITLIASAVNVADVYLVEADGSKTRRLAGQASVFLPVERGSSSVRHFLIENPHSAPVTIQNLSVTGDAFQAIVPTPWTLAGHSSNPIQITFQPRAAGLSTGALILDQRRFPLEGVGRDPALPRPSLTVGAEAGQSGKQVRIAVAFDAPARADGAGTLRAEFQPAMAGPDDPAIVFAANGTRTVPFVARLNEAQGVFTGNQKEALLQTGSTAGTLRLVAELGGYRAEATVTIAPAPVFLDTVTALRGLDILDLTVKGFDNTRSASEVSFTFYDSAGRTIDPGELRADVGDRFRRYFETSAAGGLFALRAVFPATGLTNVITAVEIGFRNQAGTQRSQRIQF